MQTIIGVRFKKAGKIYYFSPGNLAIEKGQQVIVETARGMECGMTVIGPREVEDRAVTQPLKLVHRIASASDLQRLEENKKREEEAFGICEKKIQEHKLPMKLVEVEYTFDMNKIIFYFTADGRIDFRNLVKDLASVFRTRIELRQIGVRDEAKLMGGIGCCGRPLCCASFLGDFEPVSIRMAKEQNLSLNPTKISGICGRLMCCLKYENDCYCEQCHKKPKKVVAPAQGSRVISLEGEGKVISLNQQRRTATILLDNSRTIVASWEDVIEKEAEEDLSAAEIAILSESGLEGAEEQASEEKRRDMRERPRRELQGARSRRPRRDREKSGEGRPRENRDLREKERSVSGNALNRRRLRGDNEKPGREGGSGHLQRERRPRGSREKNGSNGGGRENKE